MDCTLRRVPSVTVLRVDIRYVNKQVNIRAEIKQTQTYAKINKLYLLKAVLLYRIENHINLNVTYNFS